MATTREAAVAILESLPEVEQGTTYGNAAVDAWLAAAPDELAERFLRERPL